MESSLCEKPERHASRRLSDHLVLEGRKQKVHSLVDKVYSRKNLKLSLASRTFEAPTIRGVRVGVCAARLTMLGEHHASPSIRPCRLRASILYALRSSAS